MVALPEAPRQRQRRAGRRRLLLLLLAPLAGAALVFGLIAGSGAARRHASAPRDLRIELAPGRQVTVPLRPRSALADAVQARLPQTIRVRRSSATISYRVDRRATAAAALAAARRGAARSTVVKTAVASDIATPVVAQKLRNDCEAAALEALLATVGRRSGQLELQRELPRSGPIDPTGSGSTLAWGDPDRGYVGRADGSGPAGGFGVYPGPIAALAQRRGVKLTELTGADPARIYAHLLAGHAVMAWVGLGDGPYESWRAPDGRAIRVNLNEHTVVLTGIDADGSLSVMNPLQGTSERWSEPQFETMWERLGRRALATAGPPGRPG